MFYLSLTFRILFLGPLKKHSDGGVEMLFPEKFNYRSQDLHRGSA